MSAEPIRLGLLGCADIAARRMLPAVAATVGIMLTAGREPHAGEGRDLCCPLRGGAGARV